MAETKEARSAKAFVTYRRRGQKKAKTSEQMAELTGGFTYTDCANGESDTIEIELCNRDMRWINKWMPSVGDKITAKIKAYNWKKSGKHEVFNCGKFCCDTISFDGPELTCTIGGVSTPEGQAIRVTQRTKTWENVTIKEIASQIGNRYHMPVYYDAEEIRIESLEQSGSTDLDFLKTTCNSYGLYIKIYYGKIVIYNTARYEERKAVYTCNINDFESWSCDIDLPYTGATIKYTNGDDNNELTCKVGGGNRILNTSEKVDSLGDALRKARAKLNEENRSAQKMSIKMMANTKLSAGSCINIKGAYKLSGKYFIDKVTHSLDPNGGYTMDLELHKVQKQIV